MKQAIEAEKAETCKLKAQHKQEIIKLKETPQIKLIRILIPFGAELTVKRYRSVYVDISLQYSYPFP